jgi:two-component system, NarL family, response regulator NreC
MPPYLRLADAPDATCSPGDAITVVLADDHASVRRSLRALLDGERDLEVVAEASDLQEAARALRAHRPHVLVLDLVAPNGAACTTVEDLAGAASDTRIVVVSVNDSPALAHALMERGAAGYVLKDLADPDLPHAIRRVAEGGTYVSPRVAARARSRPSTL